MDIHHTYIHTSHRSIQAEIDPTTSVLTKTIRRRPHTTEPQATVVVPDPLDRDAGGFVEGGDPQEFPRDLFWWRDTCATVKRNRTGKNAEKL